MTDWFKVMGNRQKVYGLLAVLGTVALFYGLLSEAEVTLWLGLASNVLGLSMATAFSGAKSSAS